MADTKPDDVLSGPATPPAPADPDPARTPSLRTTPGREGPAKGLLKSRGSSVDKWEQSMRKGVSWGRTPGQALPHLSARSSDENLEGLGDVAGESGGTMESRQEGEKPQGVSPQKVPSRRADNSVLFKDAPAENDGEFGGPVSHGYDADDVPTSRLSSGEHLLSSASCSSRILSRSDSSQEILSSAFHTVYRNCKPLNPNPSPNSCPSSRISFPLLWPGEILSTSITWDAANACQSVTTSPEC